MRCALRRHDASSPSTTKFPTQTRTRGPRQSTATPPGPASPIRSTLERELETFLTDLRSESPAVLEHQLLRTRRSEPFTVEHPQG